MYDKAVKLISELRAVDELGDMTLTVTERTVFAEEKSVGQSEFYQAAALGLKPEIKLVLADHTEYKGEKKLKYMQFGGSEEEYSIIRTFRKGKEIEIVCKKGID